MNSKIKELQEKLNGLYNDKQSIIGKLQLEYNKVFDDSKTLEKAIANAEQASMYQFDEYGEVQSWYRFDGLKEFKDCKEYFEIWLSENHNMTVNWDNDCLLYSQGESLIIQGSHGRDNGVWLGSKRVIDEKEYKDDNGKVDIEKRNELIEKYMEKSGYFPGVFRTDYYGNVYPVNTQKKSA